MGLTEDRQALFFIFLTHCLNLGQRPLHHAIIFFKIAGSSYLPLKKSFTIRLRLRDLLSGATVPSPAFTTCTRAELPL